MENKEMITDFDKTEIFNKTVMPMLEELERTCTIFGIPMFACCCIKNDSEGSEYIKRGVFPETIDLTLKNDYIVKFLNVTLGFDTIYRNKNMEGVDIDEAETPNIITIDDNE